jgi:GDPmannose 4,6-dehydratase
MPSRSALTTGITGQDVSYLAEFLLHKWYEVTGILSRLSSPNLSNLTQILGRIKLGDGALMDQSSLNRAVKTSTPDEVYSLAAQSFVGSSLFQLVLTGEITGLGTLRLLDAVRTNAPHARVYHAPSSEMFGHVETEPQDNSTPFHPRSPDGVTKVYADWAHVN